MQITIEYLTQQRADIDKQRLQLVAQANQTMGAISMIDAMLERLKQDEPVPDSKP